MLGTVLPICNDYLVNPADTLSGTFYYYPNTHFIAWES